MTAQEIEDMIATNLFGGTAEAYTTNYPLSSSQITNSIRVTNASGVTITPAPIPDPTAVTYLRTGTYSVPVSGSGDSSDYTITTSSGNLTWEDPFSATVTTGSLYSGTGSWTTVTDLHGNLIRVPSRETTAGAIPHSLEEALERNFNYYLGPRGGLIGVNETDREDYDLKKLADKKPESPSPLVAFTWKK